MLSGRGILGAGQNATIQVGYRSIIVRTVCRNYYGLHLEESSVA
jgi:hypothetical protein